MLLPDSIRDLLSTLAEAPHGKGNLVPPSTPPATLAAFRTCQNNGWAEEVRLGTIRIWKVTPSGRRTLTPTTPLFATYRTFVAEC